MLRILVFGITLTAAALGQGFSGTQWRSRLSTDPALTPAQRWELFFHNDFASTGALMRTGWSAVGAQISNRPPEWKRSIGGYGRRAALAGVTLTSRDIVEHGVGAMTGRDPRYQRCNCSGAWRRIRHAFTGLVVSADGNGVRRFDPVHLGAAYASGYTGAALYPDNYSFRVKGLQLGHRQVGQAVIDNLFAEFSPEIRRIFRRGKRDPAKK